MLRSLAVDLVAELIRLLLVAELSFDVVGQQDGGVPVMPGDFLDDGAVDGVVVLLAEGHGLGAVAEKLLFADEIHQDRDSFQAIAHGGHEILLVPKIAVAGGGQIHGDGERHQNRDQAQISGGEKGGRRWQPKSFRPASCCSREMPTAKAAMTARNAIAKIHVNVGDSLLFHSALVQRIGYAGRYVIISVCP